jgi:Zn-dependent peptidase ImmA (M78 family)
VLRSVRILGQKVDIKVVTDLHHDNGRDTKPALGTYSNTNSLIELDSAQQPERMRVTLLHETLHGLLDGGGIDDLLCSIHDDLDEQVVGRLAPLLLSWLRENPPALAYILGGE